MFECKNDWKDILEREFQSDYYKSLRLFLKEEYTTKRIFPNMHDIFNAFNYTPYSEVKVVILGQDPYHGEGQAHGLAFSVQKGVDVPPSLVNIYKEQKSDLGITQPSHGNLTKWAKQGVFMLNAVLTVRANCANSHKGMGWEIFTDHIIETLAQKDDPVVFMLWGANARKKASLVKKSNHLVLQAPHPSPLSAYNGFFGCKHFSKANEFLKKMGQSPIDWQLED